MNSSTKEASVLLYGVEIGMCKEGEGLFTLINYLINININNN